MNKTISETVAILEKKMNNLATKTGDEEMDKERSARLVEVMFVLDILNDTKYRHEIMKVLDAETINK